MKFLQGNPLLATLIVVALAIVLDALVGMAVAARNGKFVLRQAGQFLRTHVLWELLGLGVLFVLQLGANAVDIPVFPQAAATGFWVGAAAVGGPLLLDILSKAEALLSGGEPASPLREPAPPPQ